MDPNLGKADAIASAFEAFLTMHAISTTIVLAIACSWTLTIALIFMLDGWQSPWRKRLVRIFDCAVAGVIVWRMWPSTHPVIWALFVGSSSPLVYLGVSELACWKWPWLRRFLSLRELAAADPAEDTEHLSPPGDTQ